MNWPVFMAGKRTRFWAAKLEDWSKIEAVTWVDSQAFPLCYCSEWGYEKNLFYSGADLIVVRTFAENGQEIGGKIVRTINWFQKSDKKCTSLL